MSLNITNKHDRGGQWQKVCALQAQWDCQKNSHTVPLAEQPRLGKPAWAVRHHTFSISELWPALMQKNTPHSATSADARWPVQDTMGTVCDGEAMPPPTPHSATSADARWPVQNTMGKVCDGEAMPPPKIGARRATTDDQSKRTTLQHWTRIEPATNPEEVATARVKLATEIMSAAATQPININGLAAPWWRARQHPAAALLREYASTG